MSTIVAPAPIPVLTSPNTRAGPLTERLTCTSITPENVDILKSLNSRLFPVPYPEAYYATTMRSELSNFCMLIYLDNIPIAQATCTLKPSERESETKLYWMLMGVLPDYRGHGVGRFACQKIMNAVLEYNRDLKYSQATTPANSHHATYNEETKNNAITTLSNYPITSLFMHVHVLNTSARRLYDHFGFKEIKRIENFYRRKSPEDTDIKDAWVLEKFVSTHKD